MLVMQVPNSQLFGVLPVMVRWTLNPRIAVSHKPSGDLGVFLGEQSQMEHLEPGLPSRTSLSCGITGQNGLSQPLMAAYSRSLAAKSLP